MNVYTFIICVLIISVSDYKEVSSRTAYDSSSYGNERDVENLPVSSSHQKKRLVSDDAGVLHNEQDQPEESERGAAMFEPQSYRKYQPAESGYVRRDNRLERQDNPEFLDESKVNMQKRDFYDVANSPKDSAIEVILDPKAKKAVAVVENSPAGQAMYDLSGWKNNKEETLPSQYESDQFPQGNQEQVVNLVYPAEVNDRKYVPESYQPSLDYTGNKIIKTSYKDKESKRSTNDTHKKKRHADITKRTSETLKLESATETKRKTDIAKADKQSNNDCPPHNVPNLENTVHEENSHNTDNVQKSPTAKRESPTWSEDQLNALSNSLAQFKDNTAEVQNLKNVLTDMGLFQNNPNANKRETNKDISKTAKVEENKENINADAEDEDLTQDNIVLKRNDRDLKEDEFMDVKNAPQEPVEKREVENTENVEEENEEDLKDVKRSDDESNAEKVNENNEDSSRQKRQDTENVENEESETTNNDKYMKREAENDSAKEVRKNRENKENEEEYEKRMENQIQAKIDAIKEKVKREIMEEELKNRMKHTLSNKEEQLQTNVRKRRTAKEENSKDESSQKAKSAPAETIPFESKGVRRKRANSLPEKQMIFRPFQAEQDEEVEEDGEFDDNPYDGRMYVDKRQTDDEADYYDPVRKREVDAYLRQYAPDQRNRRSYDDGYAESNSNAFHGNAMTNRRLAGKSLTEREKRGNSNQYKQHEETMKSNENNDNFDNEYFGSLPQEYNGELTRYKRVKRDNPYK